VFFFFFLTQSDLNIETTRTMEYFIAQNIM